MLYVTQLALTISPSHFNSPAFIFTPYCVHERELLHSSQSASTCYPQSGLTTNIETSCAQYADPRLIGCDSPTTRTQLLTRLSNNILGRSLRRFFLCAWYSNRATTSFLDPLLFSGKSSLRCSIQRPSSRRQGLWLVSGSLPISSESYQRRTSSNQASRAASMLSSTRAKHQWLCASVANCYWGSSESTAERPDIYWTIAMKLCSKSRWSVRPSNNHRGYC